MLEQTVDDAVTVSVVIRDGRGFTYHYDDFVTNSDNAQSALELLATPSTKTSPDSAGNEILQRALSALVSRV